MENNKTITATLAALGAQIIFGFSFMFTKIALGYASPMTVIADRYLVAFLGMTLVMLIKKTKIKFNKSLWKLALMSLFQPLLYFVFETYGIKLTTSAFSSIMISMIPVVSMVSGIYRYRLTLKCKNTKKFRDFLRLCIDEYLRNQENKSGIFVNMNPIQE